MITAVELALKLDKTYDPVEALGDMKRALKCVTLVVKTLVVKTLVVKTLGEALGDMKRALKCV
jgi:hypothetical protein